MLTRRRARWLLLVALAGLLVACVPVTVNITFPQRELDSAAGQIEDMVRSPENPQPAPAPKPEPQGSFLGPILAAFGPREAAAQGRRVDVVPKIKVQTPELVKAIAARRERFHVLREWKTRGCIGETNQGLLEARPGEGCSAEVSRLIGAENADRDYIYRTLMEQNEIPASDAPRVRAAFAKAHRDRAKPGEWVQLVSGQWVKK
jgi:uncharacterized protein YdbL (DUF1318 family)